MKARVSALMARLASSSTAPAPHVVDARTANEEAPAHTPARDHNSQRLALWLRPCGHCALRRTPGTAWPGYCASRDELPLAYGLLHELPADLGDGCHEYRPRG